MPSYCGFIGLSVFIQQKAKDNLRSVATLLFSYSTKRSARLQCSCQDTGKVQNVQLKISIRRYIILNFGPVNIQVNVAAQNLNTESKPQNINTLMCNHEQESDGRLLFCKIFCVLHFECLLSSQMSSKEIYLYNMLLFCRIPPRVANV